MEAHSWVWQRAGKRCLKVGVCCQAPDDTRTGRSRILKFDLSCCKLLQAGQGILWIRISRRRSCILRAELLCRVQNADLVGRHHQAERERKVQHATTSWTSLQWVCNPLTLKPQALSHQLCLSQGLDMSTDQHHPQSSTIILFLRAKQLHSDGWYSCCLHLANVTVQNRELLCTSCTNMHESHDTTQNPLQILEQWWYDNDMWWCLKHLETVRTALGPAFAQASMISSPGLAVNAWAAGVLLDLLASFGFHLLILLPV